MCQDVFGILVSVWGKVMKHSLRKLWGTIDLSRLPCAIWAHLQNLNKYCSLLTDNQLYLPCLPNVMQPSAGYYRKNPVKVSSSRFLAGADSVCLNQGSFSSTLQEGIIQWLWCTNVSNMSWMHASKIGGDKLFERTLAFLCAMPYAVQIMYCGAIGVAQNI